MAAAAGRADGINTLGDLFYEGLATPRNQELAIDNWERAAQLGSLRAQIKMARELSRGSSSERGVNPFQAYVWAVIAASNNSERVIDRIFDLELGDQSTKKEALTLREKLERNLSKAEAQRAQAVARAWKPKAPSKVESTSQR